MRKAGKTYITFNKIRLALFVRSYTHFAIRNYLVTKYKINNKLSPKNLRKQYFNKHAIPDISRHSKVLNLSYAELWKSILLNKTKTVNKKIIDKEKIHVFLAIEHEIIQLAIQKQNKSDYFDPDYESDFALLNVAIERAVGNVLNDIEDDFYFTHQSEELKRKYTYLYYKIAHKYKLPTLRITPFILRLIS